MPKSLKRKYKKSQRRIYKKNTFKKSSKRKSLIRKSLIRKSLKRKSFKRKSLKRKSFKNIKLKGGMQPGHGIMRPDIVNARPDAMSINPMAFQFGAVPTSGASPAAAPGMSRIDDEIFKVDAAEELAAQQRAARRSGFEDLEGTASAKSQYPGPRRPVTAPRGPVTAPPDILGRTDVPHPGPSVPLGGQYDVGNGWTAPQHLAAQPAAAAAAAPRSTMDARSFLNRLSRRREPEPEPQSPFANVEDAFRTAKPKAIE